MDSVIKKIRSAYQKLNNKDIEESIKLHIIYDIFLKEMGFDTSEIMPEMKSGRGRCDFALPIKETNDHLCIEIKRGSQSILYENIEQIYNYLSNNGWEWGIVTNGYEYFLINAKIENHKDSKGSLEDKIVFRFNVFETKSKEYDELKYFDFLSAKNLYIDSNTNYFADIAQFKAWKFFNNQKSWKVYKSTLFSFFAFYSTGRKYRNTKTALQGIGRDDFLDYISYKQENSEKKNHRLKSKRSIENNYSHMSSMLKTFKEHGVIQYSEFENNRMENLDVIQETTKQKETNELNSDNINIILNYFDSKKRGYKESAIFLLCATLGLERSRLIELKWDEIHFKERESYILIQDRKLPICKKLEFYLKRTKDEYDRKKIKTGYVFNSLFNGKYKAISISYINKVFNSIQNISNDEKWKMFSPQYVRICLVKMMYEKGYSIDQITYIVGTELKNISEYITFDMIVSRCNCKKMISMEKILEETDN